MKLGGDGGRKQVQIRFLKDLDRNRQRKRGGSL